MTTEQDKANAAANADARANARADAKAEVAAERRAETAKSQTFAGVISSLKGIEKTLSEAFVDYQGTKADRASGHVIHAAHNSHGEHAGRELGRAHGGVIQAIAALEVFAGKEKTAADAYALAEDEAERKRVFYEDKDKNLDGVTPEAKQDAWLKSEVDFKAAQERDAQDAARRRVATQAARGGAK